MYTAEDRWQMFHFCPVFSVFCDVMLNLSIFKHYRLHDVLMLGTVSCSSNNEVSDRFLKSNLNKSRLDSTFPKVKQILQFVFAAHHNQTNLID